MTFKLTSPAFDHGSAIPRRHTCSGENVSPPFEWRGAPEGTKSFALVCDDPDAPGGTFYHWAVFDMPATAEGIAEAMPPTKIVSGGLRQATNDFGRVGFAGPCPPKRHGTHHYHFRLLALDVEHLGLGSPVRCRQVAVAAQAHSLAAVEIVGLFER